MKKTKLNLLTQLLLTTFFSTTIINTSFAIDLGSVTSGNTNDYTNDPSSAPNQAPSQSSLTATEPQSIISQKYLQNNLPGASTYVEGAALAPGVVAAPVNGYGASDQPNLFIRGFADGQYNVLFDGIPFADGQDQTHHATSYMLGEDTGSIIVDRGPGRADTVGLATFGGTIAVNSKDPLDKTGITTRLQYGSFDSKLFGAQIDTGVLNNYSDARGFLDFNSFDSNGAYTYSSSHRTNIFGKFIKPINDNLTLTFVGMVNNTQQHFGAGITPAQESQFGPQLGFNNNMSSQAFYGYNQDTFKSYFYYIGLKGNSGKWNFDNKLYTNSYSHNALQGLSRDGLSDGPNLISSPNTTLNGGTPFTPGANDVPGQTGITQYITYGDIFKSTYNLGRDDIGAGVWLQRQTHDATNYNIDLTNNVLYGSSLAGTQQWNGINTFQPYLEYTWRPIDKLEVTPGVKYDSVTQDQTNIGANYVSATYTALLPSLDIHYYLRKNWSVYMQAAEGFVPPAIATYYQTNGSSQYAPSNIKPETTKNYQFGSVFKTDKFSLSGDIYFINNNNLIQSVPSGGIFTYYSNSGNVNYSGIDTEGTYKLGSGFSIYGNYTFERTNAQASSPIFMAPSTTSAIGVLYDKNNLNASLIAKAIGRSISGLDQNSNPYYIGGYTLVNFAGGYKFNHLGSYAQNAQLQFQALNLTNIYVPVAQNGVASDNSGPRFYYLFGRTYNISLSTTF